MNILRLSVLNDKPSDRLADGRMDKTDGTPPLYSIGYCPLMGPLPCLFSFLHFISWQDKGIADLVIPLNANDLFSTAVSLI